ncbi:hypothetical protein [Streptomyces albidoflavus]|uniref:hypothetical protein n=1 Tax=Streptomyces albidoflavus TaxID=1886 RepID=UPI0004C7634A
MALLAEPDAPAEIAQHMARILPDRLAERSGEGRQFEVKAVREPLTAGAQDPSTLMHRMVERKSAENWDIIVALTDLPLHAQGRMLAVEVSHEHGVALLCLPALGALRLRRRAQQVVEEAVLSLGSTRTIRAGSSPSGRPLTRPFGGRLSPVHKGPVDEEETADLRYIVTGPRGYLKLLGGMVRANQPWRLVPGLSKALAAALATGAIATVNSTVWSLAGALSVPRLVIAMVGSIAIMTGWLIVDAQLWQRARKESPEALQRARLYNASTVATVGIGVIVCYAGLMVINLVWALFILNDQVFASFTQHPLQATDYWTLTWFVASVATVGGALGSSLESDQAVRAAAYSKREQERREMLQNDKADQSKS